MSSTKSYNEPYIGTNLNHVAFPLGGIGAGMICLEGTGAISHVSVRNKPDVYSEPLMFSALHVKGKPAIARVLEGPVPERKIFGPAGTANGGKGRSYGLPRFSDASFLARFPFGTTTLNDNAVPLATWVTGWSPFTPGDADNASIPVAALEYSFKNTSDETVNAVYSFHAENFMATNRHGKEVLSTENGFVLFQAGKEIKPWDLGSFSATIDDPNTKVNARWFRSGWFDALTLVWKSIADGTTPEHGAVGRERPSPGGSLYVPFRLDSGEEKTITVRLAWYVPITDVRVGKDDANGNGNGKPKPTYIPWYAQRFKDIHDLDIYWREHYGDLREKSALFADCFYDTTLPDEVVEAIAANLTILKSPTALRQRGGKFWGWEGCCDGAGCCPGSCTHVWNYAQALPHLFPNLERSMRLTEFNECQDERGHQNFRAPLPIRPALHDHHAAADGQLGGIMKVYREWRISGNTEWLRELWPRVKESLDYCIETWDPQHKGVLIEPHHNTYDIEFWGPDGMCSSFYLGALKAAVRMAKVIGDDGSVYGELFDRGKTYLEKELYDGEYFFQDIQWKNLLARDPVDEARENGSEELAAMTAAEGPRYQYGKGCLSDGVLGAWMAEVCGLEDTLNTDKVRSHLLAVHKYNLRKDLSGHPNPQRPTYALGKEGGLLLCSWPNGDELSLPFVYSNEVWTGIEYQVASHLMMTGRIEEGLEIVRICRDRYDGRVRNPFNEYECGHWYARAMSSYSLIQGMTGVRYDALEKALYVSPRIQGDFRSFLCTATGFGTAGVKNGEPFLEVRSGTIEIRKTQYEPEV